MSVRGVGAATVSDEYGKGIELLRTSTIHHVGGGAGTYAAFYAEVDCYIRYIKIIHEAAISTGAVQVSVATVGSSTATTISGILEIASTSTYRALDITIRNPRVPKDSILFIAFTTVTPTTSPVQAQVGWMPDLWNQDSNPVTYLSPG